MIIVGITGPISHGKTTVADTLAELEPALCHFESSFIISEVANAMHATLQSAPDPYDIDALNTWLQQLPAILEQTVHVQTTFDTIKLTEQAFKDHPVDYQKLILHVENLRRDPKLMQQAIDPENKNYYRPFLQWLGGYLSQKVDPGIWYTEVVRRVHAAEQRGCQFCIVGGLRYPTDATILRGVGAKIIKIYRPGHLQNDMLDPTERERENIQVDATILSTGTLDDLKKCVAVVYHDLQNDQLKTEYQTALSIQSH